MTAALKGAGPNTPPPDDDRRDAGRRRIRWSLLALVVVVLGVAAFAQTDPGRDALASLGLSSRADHFTALSFTEPEALSQPVTDLVKATFAITNHEGASRDYEWTVSIGDGDARHTVTDGVLTVDDGATGNVDPAIPSPCSPSDESATATRQRVTVAITDPDQSIGFWLTCAGTTP